MNILFVCRGNVGRSVMAEAILRKLKPDLHVTSAGTIVRDKDGNDKNGQLLKDCPGASKVIDVLREIGADVSHKARVQLQPEMLKDKERIIVMAEKENIPGYLSSYPNYVFWNVLDPKGTDIDTHRTTRNKIQKLIEDNISLFQ